MMRVFLLSSVVYGQNLLQRSNGYRQQKRQLQVKEKCEYKKFDNVVKDEGNDLAIWKDKSQAECEVLCDQEERCQSFAYEASVGNCWAKDKKLTGDEEQKFNRGIYTVYKVCQQVQVTCSANKAAECIECSVDNNGAPCSSQDGISFTGGMCSKEKPHTCAPNFSPQSGDCPNGYDLDTNGVGADTKHCDGSQAGGYCILTHEEASVFCQRELCTVVSQTSNADWLDYFGQSVQIFFGNATRNVTANSGWKSCVRKEPNFAPQSGDCPYGYDLVTTGLGADNKFCNGTKSDGANCILAQEEALEFCQRELCIVVSQTSNAEWLNYFGQTSVTIFFGNATRNLKESPEWKSCVRREAPTTPTTNAPTTNAPTTDPPTYVTMTTITTGGQCSGECSHDDDCGAGCVCGGGFCAPDC